MKRLIVSLLLICLALVAASCSDDPETAPEATSGADANGATSQASSSSSDDDSGKSDSDASDSDGSGHSGTDSDSDGVAVATNPGFEGTGIDISRNTALAGAEPLDVVNWTSEPVIEGSALSTHGVLDHGYTLFNPMVDGEGASFIVYYKGNPEPLALLLPDLGPTHIWETDHTVATMEHEFEGESLFSFTAYSPLFMDVGPGDLELRVFGYDSTSGDDRNIKDTLLAVIPVAVE